jgi:hypothetical protein
VCALSTEAKDYWGLLRAGEQKDQPNEKGKYLQTGRSHTGAKPIEQRLGKTFRQETQDHRSERRMRNRIHEQEPLAPRTWRTETEGFMQNIESRAKERNLQRRRRLVLRLKKNQSKISAYEIRHSTESLRCKMRIFFLNSTQLQLIHKVHRPPPSFNWNKKLNLILGSLLK